MTISQNLDHIHPQIPASVRLVAVSKQMPVEAIKEAYDAGIRDFAESRLQEGLEKQAQLQEYNDICWHFIGHLQTNKAKKVLEHFHWIHSVDSLNLAQRLDELAAKSSIYPQVCLQVKILPDPNKYGWQVTELWEDLPKLEALQHLKIEGLMTILPLGLSEKDCLETFGKTRELAKTITEKSSLKLEHLSMGMSNDYLLAIQKGATMIRLGRIIFGDRN
ncbi:YggS family pyridoxal phosphate-dependent enzyme [Crocosphaera sp. UHCC 0190]|uniref:YggS family pyridoxal phosphate-dependent enzyme n=1 Tax=Crocosphaera sp. UHCC 0190 TaxID=3110246 RepID=UPI002B1E9E7F|nr:YggS family pyridoxal phosphate-dependent enzyme [Crocosphaera sp. UHCC 0190]MEA5509862.1 YggS family pyridoxal phosphate-dependent enzyme [Crocosphaera sp. UHCC 0190]